MDQPAQLSKLLFELHDIGVLEKLVPDVTHARCLVQFNEYHKYTIDEHSIIAVRKCCEFNNDKGLLGKIYKSIKKKWILHLALLLHDLGKGFDEEHAEVGKRIAERIAARFSLTDEDTELLVFLVHQHLKMSHLAFWRDTSDDQLIVKFATECGTPEALQMLFLLTIADTSAVGPGVYNDWKRDILFDLYRKANLYLSGKRKSLESEESLKAIHKEILEEVDAGSDSWFKVQLTNLTPAFVYGTKPSRIAEILKKLRHLKSEAVFVDSEYHEESDTVEYLVGSHEGLCPGVFHRLVGALAEKDTQIMSAEINTLSAGVILDRFLVSESNLTGEPPESRQTEIKNALKKVFTEEREPNLKQKKRYGQPDAHPELTLMPTKVKIDNNTSEAFTIIDVFAADRRGLLHHIGSQLYDMGLSISFAKIGTHLDQVVDVFYVTDQEGNKIVDTERVREIKNTLLSSIEEFERTAD